MHSHCRKCPARCCRYFCFEIDKPDTYEDFENIRWYLTHQNISVHIDNEGDWCILIDNKCRNLIKTPQGLRCKDYDNRPLICRKFSPANCDFTKGGYELEEDFRTPAQLQAYARRMLGDIAWQEGLKLSKKLAEADKPKRPAKPKKQAKTSKPRQPAKRTTTHA